MTWHIGITDLLREQAQSAGVSQRELARRLQCTPAAINAIWRGRTRCSLDRARQILLAIDPACSPLHLLARLEAGQPDT